MKWNELIFRKITCLRRTFYSTLIEIGDFMVDPSRQGRQWRCGAKVPQANGTFIIDYWMNIPGQGFDFMFWPAPPNMPLFRPAGPKTSMFRPVSTKRDMFWPARPKISIFWPISSELYITRQWLRKIISTNFDVGKRFPSSLHVLNLATNSYLFRKHNDP